jgi:hypothetical protein
MASLAKEIAKIVVFRIAAHEKTNWKRSKVPRRLVKVWTTIPATSADSRSLSGGRQEVGGLVGYSRNWRGSFAACLGAL